MTTNRALAIGGFVLVISVVAAAIWVGTAIRGMRGEIAAVSHQLGSELATQRSAISELAIAAEKAEAASNMEADPFAGVEQKEAGAITARMDKLSPEAGIEEVGKVIEEMDQWVFKVEEAEAASEKLNEWTQTLRGRIEEKINELLEQARVAEDGKLATGFMSQVNDLLSLYPMPRGAEQRSQLEKLTERILATSQRVEDIRRLRYNAWAINQIGSGLSAYHSNKRRVFNEDDALVEGCHRHLRDIDPALLEPSALELYNYVIGLTAKAVKDEHRVELARGFADVGTARRTLADF